MTTKFNVGDRVEPNNIKYVVSGIRICSNGTVTYTLSIQGEYVDSQGYPTSYIMGTLEDILEKDIDRFFAKGVKVY